MIFVVAFIVGMIATRFVINATLIAIYIAPFTVFFAEDHVPLTVYVILCTVAAIITSRPYRWVYVVMGIGVTVFRAMAALLGAIIAKVDSGVVAFGLAAILAAVLVVVVRTLPPTPPSNMRCLKQQADGIAKPMKTSASRPTTIFSMLVRLCRRFRRPLQAGDIVQCVEPAGDLQPGLYTVRSRVNRYVRLREIDGGWKIHRFSRWTVRS